jgi:FXSXX-COOH protein
MTLEEILASENPNLLEALKAIVETPEGETVAGFQSAI